MIDAGAAAKAFDSETFRPVVRGREFEDFAVGQVWCHARVTPREVIARTGSDGFWDMAAEVSPGLFRRFSALVADLRRSQDEVARPYPPLIVVAKVEKLLTSVRARRVHGAAIPVFPTRCGDIRQR